MTSGSGSGSAVKLQRVTKQYRGARGRVVMALSGIDLELAPGDVVALVGQSGCGKSTLLRLVAGLETATGGEVSLNGEPVRAPAPQCAVVFQEHRLFPWLTVAQNVGFALRGRPKDEQLALIAEQLALMGLSEFDGAYPHQLSGGMAQRVALARALVRGPSVLLLDEPFAALDAFTKTRLQEELWRSRESTQPTTLFVTHDIEEAVYLADRIVVLSEAPGTIREQFAIELQRPRDRTSSAFSSWRRRVLRHFDGSAGFSSAPTSAASPIPINRGLPSSFAARTKGAL
jgi:sulfonate transport system ATP-binding protein